MKMNRMIKNLEILKKIIEPARIRTWNLLIRSQARYPLRHRSYWHGFVVRPVECRVLWRKCREGGKSKRAVFGAKLFVEGSFS